MSLVVSSHLEGRAESITTIARVHSRGPLGRRYPSDRNSVGFSLAEAQVSAPLENTVPLA